MDYLRTFAIICLSLLLINNIRAVRVRRYRPRRRHISFSTDSSSGSSLLFTRAPSSRSRWITVEQKGRDRNNKYSRKNGGWTLASIKPVAKRLQSSQPATESSESKPRSNRMSRQKGQQVDSKNSPTTGTFVFSPSFEKLIQQAQNARVKRQNRQKERTKHTHK